MKELKLSKGFVSFLVLLILSAAGATAAAEETFPASSLVRQRCGACHKPDPQGKLDVIEETRKSPEEWKAVMIRMQRLNGAPITDSDFHPLVKELSDKLSLTPQEMATVAYYNSGENSQYREVPQGDEEKRIYTACVRCHTHAKIASHRMTEAQWVANRDLHLGYYPTVVPQMREMDWPKESKELIPILTKRFPYENPDWSEWMQNRKDQDLSGDWVAAGYQPGLGYYQGAYTFKADPDKGNDEYFIEKTMRFQDGTHLKLEGEGTLYGEYHLRCAFAPTPLTGRIEGVFDLDADKGQFSGKWWTVVQDTNAHGNEMFLRAGEEPRILAAFPKALQAGLQGDQELQLIGAGLSQELAPEDIRFSDENVQVKSVESAADSSVLCKVTVGEGASTGPVELSVKGVAYENPITVFDSMDGIKIFPALGRARVSCGAAYPPQGVQFVARAVDFGKDGQPDTEDDMILEPVEADWWLEEEKTRENDDDLKYLKTSIMNGLYTPVTTYGPIEERRQKREGVGLIAVGASYEVAGKELKGRALLGVTVPDFVTHIK